MRAAEACGTLVETRRCLEEVVAQEPPGGSVVKMLGREIGL